MPLKMKTRGPSTRQQVQYYGSSEPVRQAWIKSALGFEDILIVPNLDSYSPSGQNLQGWINHRSAVLVAIANVAPDPAVRNLLSRYEVLVDPATQIGFTYKGMGNSTTDVAQDVVEVSYGSNLGIASALGRITIS